MQCLLRRRRSSTPPPYRYSTEHLINVPGVRFVPTDHELIVHFLRPKLMHGAENDYFFPPDVVHVADVYGEHPLDLVSRLGESMEGSWYVLSPRRRKYPNGKRPRRDTGSAGFWKAMGKNDDILDVDEQRHVIGQKRALTYHDLVQYVDAGDGDSQQPPRRRRTKKDCSRVTDWKMVEFVSVNSDRPVASTTEDAMLLNDWVLCKITRKEEKKNTGPKSDQGAADAGTQKSAGGEDVVVDPADPDPILRSLDSWFFDNAGTNLSWIHI